MSELPELPEIARVEKSDGELREPAKSPGMPTISEEDASSIRAGVLLSTAGLTLALSVGVGVGLGLLVDGWLKTTFMVIVFALIGTVAGFRQLFQAVNRVSRAQDRQEELRRRKTDTERRG